jgi:protein TonB
MYMPVYPERALKDRIRGLVVLRVLVSETGVPLDVKVVKAARADLTDAAVSAARQWRFEPARKGGRAVRTFAIVDFPFEGVQFARTPFPPPDVTPSSP